MCIYILIKKINHQIIDVNSDESKYFGKFLLYSNYNIDSANVHSTYVQRQDIEQTFDYWKNNNKLIPIRVHGT